MVLPRFLSLALPPPLRSTLLSFTASPTSSLQHLVSSSNTRPEQSTNHDTSAPHKGCSSPHCPQPSERCQRQAPGCHPQFSSVSRTHMDCHHWTSSTPPPKCIPKFGPYLCTTSPHPWLSPTVLCPPRSQSGLLKAETGPYWCLPPPTDFPCHSGPRPDSALWLVKAATTQPPWVLHPHVPSCFPP